MKRYIALVGELGSGKETCGKILQKLHTDKKVIVYRFSDLLRSLLTTLNIPHTRENLQDIAIIVNNHFGEGTISRAVEHALRSIEADLIIIDGVRWLSDEELVRSLPNSQLWYITATENIRYERIKNRNEKTGEHGITFEEFLASQQKKNELQIPDIGSRADVKIENNGSLGELESKIKSVLLLTRLMIV